MKQLLILPFDHRGTITKKLYGLTRPPTEDETEQIKGLKRLIFDGLLKAILQGVPKDQAAILVDEQYGSAILADAKAQGITTMMSTEKSGQKEFVFEHDDWQAHFDDVKPDYAKILLRYNPDADQELNKRQLERVKQVNDYLKDKETGLLVEPLVPATQEQLDSVDGDQERYDKELRPKLMVKMMGEFVASGITPDVWKLEGVDSAEDCAALVEAAKRADPAGKIVILGRGASAEKVSEWLTIGAKTPGVEGFAVGRTIFWDALKGFKEGTKSREAAVDEIAKNYKGFVDLWVANKV